jgi:flagellar biosynthesis chaperone FliJ
MKEETNLLKLKDKKLKQIEYQEVRYDVKIKDELNTAGI